MKELSLEAKAKAYDEALNWMRDLYPNLGIAAKEKAESIFPELAESEDEKIRKALIRFHKSTIDIDGIKGNEIVAWLEQQGEKPKKTSIWNHWKDGICGNGEGKLIYLIKDGDDYSLSSSLAYECDYIELSDLDELMLPKKQGEQKSVIWSKEDERLLNNMVIVIQDYYNKEDAQSLIFWLKSLKERYTWKPSDEQMKQLGWIAEQNKDNMIGKELISLYQDLKKLREE